LDSCGITSRCLPWELIVRPKRRRMRKRRFAGTSERSSQEKLISGSSIPIPIVHATRFFEFIDDIADAPSDGTTVRVASVLIQPMTAADVAAGA
jgi:hypothetical protein